MVTGENILEFSDFRTFLKTHFEDMKAINPHWSLGAWARKLQLSATASLSMVLNGQRLPGPRMTESLVRYFGFKDEKRKQYFLDLIRVAKLKKDPEVRLLLLQKLGQQHSRGGFRILGAEHFAVISKWHHYAIREMTRLEGFQEDPAWIGKRLLFRVPAREIDKAIQRLLELKMLIRDEKGRLLSSDETLDTSADVRDEGLRRFHEQMIENAKQSLRKVNVKEREIRGTTLTIRKDVLPLAKEKLRAFMAEMLELLESPDSGDSTYQLNIQFFPLTKSRKTKKKETENAPNS